MPLNSARAEASAYQLVLRDGSVAVEVEHVEHKLGLGIEAAVGHDAKGANGAEGVNPVTRRKIPQQNQYPGTRVTRMCLWHPQGTDARETRV